MARFGSAMASKLAPTMPQMGKVPASPIKKKKKPFGGGGMTSNVMKSTSPFAKAFGK